MESLILSSMESYFDFSLKIDLYEKKVLSSLFMFMRFWCVDSVYVIILCLCKGIGNI